MRIGNRRHEAYGRPAGIEGWPERHEPAPAEAVRIQVTDYGPDRSDTYQATDLDVVLASEVPEWSRVRWIDVETRHANVVERFRETYKLHTLAAEDVLTSPQRPKCDIYEDQLFLVAQMLWLEGDELVEEQVGIFLLQDLLITFQERPGDVWGPIRRRIADEGSRLRSQGPDYLLYALLDAIVDRVFPILEHFGDRLEVLEDSVLETPRPEVLHEVHALRRELLRLRHAMWPLRQVIDELEREGGSRLTATTRTYLRDVYQHVVQIIDFIETYRELGSSLTEFYMSSLSQRMNEIMKVLTIIATLFIPITFLAGVYGMNFRYLPELQWRHGYAAFWALCLAITIGLVVYFWRRGWLREE